MKNKRLALTLATGWMVTVGTAVVAHAEQRPWSVRDSIEMTYFASADSEFSFPGIIAARPVASPDRERFFVITQRGELSSDTMVYEIQVYQVADIEAALDAKSAAPKPVGVQTIRSRFSQARGLREVRWTADSSALTYLEAAGNQNHQVKLWDLETSQVVTLTKEQHGVEAYAMRGDSLVFNVCVQPTNKDPLYKYPVTYVRLEQWRRALSPTSIWPACTLFLRQADGETRQLSAPQSGNRGALEQTAFISPDARAAIVATAIPPDEVNAAWNEYQRLYPFYGEPRRFMLVDPKTQRSRPLLDAPTGLFLHHYSEAEALWFADSKRVILVNTLLPLDSRKPERRDTAYIVEHDLQTGKHLIIGALPRAEGTQSPARVAARWLQEGRELLVTTAGSERATVYTRGKQGWSAREVAAPPSDSAVVRFERDITVEITQGMNEPPRLVATQGAQRLVLSESDPVVERARRQPVEHIHWKDRNGFDWDGLLVLPEGDKPANGHPLVIQIAPLYPEMFFPDGIAQIPGMAAQAMAAKGFAVLTLNPNGGQPQVVNTPQEGANMVAGADGLVAHLQAKSLIDKSRIGVIGFSRTGYRTLYISTHPSEFVPAAAIVQDSFDASYMQYAINFTIAPQATSTYKPGSEREPMYAPGGSFWENPQGWVADAPAFNLARMNLPLLITNHDAPSPWGLTSMAEIYGGLRRLGRPVEAVSYVDAAHTFFRPQQQFASVQLAIDWMSFWIKGEESNEHAHAERNAHWRSMREEWKRAEQQQAVDETRSQ